MADFSFTKKEYIELCEAKDLGTFRSIVDGVSDEDRSRFGSTTFCPPPSTDLPSPLVTAAHRPGQLQTLQYLLDTYPFIDVDAIGISWYLHSLRPVIVSSLVAACRCYPLSFDTIEYLVSRGANVNQVAEGGQSPLLILGDHHVKQFCDIYERAMKFLVKNGADVSKADESGNTLLFGSYPKLAVELGTDIHHRNAEGYTALHVASEAGNDEAVGMLLSAGLPPLFSTWQHIPCPLYLAAARGHRKIVDLFLKRDDCPPECVADAHLLLGIVNCASGFLGSEGLQIMQAYKDMTESLQCVSKHNIKLSYPPPRPEYDYQEEIQSNDELDAVWGTDEFMKKGLLLQCALIAERCLGPNSVFYAEMLFQMGRQLIGNKYFVEGERLWELSINTCLSLNKHLFLAEIFVKHVEIMARNNYIPKFPCYIKYVLFDLDYDDSRISENRRFLLGLALDLFMWWSVYGIDTTLFSSVLQAFVEKYIVCFQGSSIVHEAITVAASNIGKKMPGITGQVAGSFIGTLLEAGGDRVIDSANAKGQRPLHTCTKYTDFARLLVEHGAHADAVNLKGETAFPRGTFGVPSLYCTVANAIVQYSLPYQSIGLPSHVVQYIRLHDYN